MTSMIYVTNVVPPGYLNQANVECYFRAVTVATVTGEGSGQEKLL